MEFYQCHDIKNILTFITHLSGLQDEIDLLKMGDKSTEIPHYTLMSRAHYYDNR